MVNFLAHFQTADQFENVPFSVVTVSKSGIWQTRSEPRRICRRPFGLSYAAMAGSTSLAAPSVRVVSTCQAPIRTQGQCRRRLRATGIHASAGGFYIDGEGKRKLEGDLITSEAGADKNRLETGTLEFVDTYTPNPSYIERHRERFSSL